MPMRWSSRSVPPHWFQGQVPSSTPADYNRKSATGDATLTSQVLIAITGRSDGHLDVL